MTSSDHAELAAGELVLEQPVAQVDCEIDLVRLANFHQVTVLVHVHGHEVVADFRSVFGGIGQAELVVLRGFCELWLLFEKDFVALDALLPANLVEALSEEDHVSQDSFVEHLVSLARRSV